MHCVCVCVFPIWCVYSMIVRALIRALCCPPVFWSGTVFHTRDDRLCVVFWHLLPEWLERHGEAHSNCKWAVCCAPWALTGSGKSHQIVNSTGADSWQSVRPTYCSAGSSRRWGEACYLRESLKVKFLQRRHGPWSCWTHRCAPVADRRWLEVLNLKCKFIYLTDRQNNSVSRGRDEGGGIHVQYIWMMDEMRSEIKLFRIKKKIFIWLLK